MDKVLLEAWIRQAREIPILDQGFVENCAVPLAREIKRFGSGMIQTVAPEAASPKRVYFEPFKSLALNYGVRRAAILLGPRRVGKTFRTRA
jgi:hypothetical protein